MNQRTATVYPVAGLEVKVETEKRIVIVHLPYFSDFGTEKQQENAERAYVMLPEQAAILRDSLTAALDRLNE